MGDDMDFQQFWNSFAGTITSLLPASPTIDNAALEVLATYSGYINYFVPVGAYLTFLSALLVAVAAYYAAMVILRWTKLIS